jgi:phage baseplate assembly protein W
MKNLDYPFHIDRKGLTATADDAEHVRQMIEQLIFTNPGERVNRPDFGSGVLRLIFAPTSPEVAAALQFTVQGALQRWLGDIIEVRLVQVTSEDSSLFVAVQYTLRRTGEAFTQTFERTGIS